MTAMPLIAERSFLVAGRLTQPGLVNEYQLRLDRQRQVWFITLADQRGVCR